MSGSTDVIGYFAVRRGTFDVLCDGDAAVITATVELMRRYLHEFGGGDLAHTVIKKTTYQEIERGLRLGGAYSFDVRAYKRFLPLARAAGRLVADLNDDPGSATSPQAIHLIRVQWL